MSWVTQVSEVNPKPGDLIEISRSGYEHWAMYIGVGNVVHVCADGPGSCSLSSSSSSRRAVIKEEPLCDVVGEDKFRINNKYDGRYTPLSVKKIILTAKEAVGRVISYKVFSKNCEHFVTDLRYGIPVSDQVTDAVAGAKDAVVDAVDVDTIASGVTAVGLSIIASAADALRQLF